MIRGIFSWLKKAVKLRTIGSCDISVTSLKENDFYIIPEGMYPEGGCAMAENYIHTCHADPLTQYVAMGHIQFLYHNIDQRRFVLARHDDGHIYIFEVNDPEECVYTEVNQFSAATYFRLWNAKLIAVTLNGEARVENKKAYAFYTDALDPATLEIAA